jgi:hypothetical protein
MHAHSDASGSGVRQLPEHAGCLPGRDLGNVNQLAHDWLPASADCRSLYVGNRNRRLRQACLKRLDGTELPRCNRTGSTWIALAVFAEPGCRLAQPGLMLKNAEQWKHACLVTLLPAPPGCLCALVMRLRRRLAVPAVPRVPSSTCDTNLTRRKGRSWRSGTHCWRNFDRHQLIGCWASLA